MDLRSAKTRKALRRQFETRFGCAPLAPLCCALAPGRVNLIGEHTDYNGGFVLPMALALHTAVVFRPRDEPRLAVHSATIAGEGGVPDDEFGLTLDAIPRLEAPERRWANYVRGVAAALLKRGVELRGGDLFITADLPQGAGLSSSASLEVAAALALLSLAGAEMDRQALALACQEAEHTYAGVRCGIMDQTVVARARPGHALLLDCKSLAVRHVPIKLKGWSFAVFDTGVRHTLAAGEYNKRRAACEHAAQVLGVPTLREATVEHLLAHGAELTSEEYRRTRHVLSEDLRAVQFADTLASGDVWTLGRLLNEGHRSLAHDYEVTCEELDWLQILLNGAHLNGKCVCAGVRMTGGGFGGSVVALLRPAAFEPLRRRAAQEFRKLFGQPPGRALLAVPGAGAEVLELQG